MITGYVLHAAVLLVAFINPGDGLSCWMCSSDKESQQFCRDPFNISTPFVYTRDCSNTLPASPRPGYQQYCVKLIIQPQLGRPVTHRMCRWGPKVDPEAELCSPYTGVDRETMEHCHVCSTTGCNGSSGLHSRRPLRAALTLLGWLVLRS